MRSQCCLCGSLPLMRMTSLSHHQAGFILALASPPMQCLSARQVVGICLIPHARRAQRNDVVIDACVLGGADSPFLQQAAHITGGLYLRPARPGGLLQTLLARPSLENPTLAGQQLEKGPTSLAERPLTGLFDCCGVAAHTQCSNVSLLLDVCVMAPERAADRSQTVFCGDTHSRGFLDLPQATGVDFRASCFCHKVLPPASMHVSHLSCLLFPFFVCHTVLRDRCHPVAHAAVMHLQRAIDLGFVCSVCLSIFCQVCPCNPSVSPVRSRVLP